MNAPSDQNALIVPGCCEIPYEEIEITYVRSSGPGGQNVNKVSSKARLRWSLNAGRITTEIAERFKKLYPSYVTENGEVVIASDVFRDAPKNKDACLDKLRDALQKAAIIPKKRIPTKPTRGSILRRLNDKKRTSDKKRARSQKDFD